MLWLGDKRGNMSDWTTQQWVRMTGRSISLGKYPWLDGPTGGTHRIGSDFFEIYAKNHDLELVEDGARGLLPDFGALGNHVLGAAAAEVKEFYERTSSFDLDAWSEWHGLFRPLGGVLSILFSTRLQQLNVPLSPLDSAKGMTSSVQQMRLRGGTTVVQTAWVRRLIATGKVIYAGSYSTCQVPGCSTPCVKVVFPLPHGRAIVLMKVEVQPDASLTLRSIGDGFGDPGFYFVVEDEAGKVWARYVASMKEEIRVFPGEPGTVRADHRLWLWGIEFLRLHYRMRKRLSGSDAA
jgi:hypothetical protein